IFDTLGGILSASAFEAASSRWIKRVIGSLRGKVPVIVFSKGAHGVWDALLATGADALGVDWTQRLSVVRALLPEHIAVQGNLDPALLCTTPEAVASETQRILHDMRDARGHIFNLGHGVP